MNRPMLPRLCQIQEVLRETDETFTWRLSPPAGDEAFAFAPGQFNMLYQFGIGEVPISISGASHETGEIVHTIRAVGGVTRAMQGLEAGASVGLRGPFGTSWPVEQLEGLDLLLIAGGIGLAPLRPALYHVLERRESYGKVVLLYGARQPRELLFLDELEAWSRRSDLQCLVTVDMGDAHWRGHVGLVTQLIRRAHFDPYHSAAMLCGPEVMMRFCAQSLLDGGLDAGSIYVSMERNMKCAVGWCGHCQLGPHFVCKDGPVYPYPTMQPWLQRREA